MEATARTLTARFDPNLASMAVDDRFADRQPRARAGELLTGVQTFEHFEHTIGVRRVDADTVIDDRESMAVRLRRCRDSHSHRLLAAVFERVTDEVLQQLLKVHGVGPYRRQIVPLDGCVGLVDTLSQVRQYRLERLATVGALQRELAGADARKL